MLKKLELARSVVRYALDNGISLKAALRHFGLHHDYLRSLIRQLKADGKIGTNETAKLFLDDYDKASNQFKNGHAPKAEKNPLQKLTTEVLKIELASEPVVEETNPNPKKPQTWLNRSDKGLITSYAYNLTAKGERNLEGSLSRQQMEIIHEHYPYDTLAQVSTEFPLLTQKDLGRIARAFKITKDSKFPTHILEEYSEDEILQFALRAKEKKANKRLLNDRPQILEKRLLELQGKIIQLEEDKKWIDNLFTTFFTKDRIKPVDTEYIKAYPATQIETKARNTYAIFSDIHFGKRFECDEVVYGRGTDKFILRDRLLKMAEETIKAAIENRSKSVQLVFLGDLLESMIPDGMHPQQTEHMDLLGFEQLTWAVDVFEEVFTVLVAGLPETTGVFMDGIGGNHDRVLKMREEDKKRTGAVLFYEFLRRIVRLKYRDRKGSVDVISHKNNIMQFHNNEEGLSFIGHHGDTGLAKRTPLELMNLFKKGDNANYTVILQGHLHNNKVLAEGGNFINLQLGAICSTDDFAQNQYGFTAQPSFILAHKADRYGFDYKKVTLY